MSKANILVNIRDNAKKAQKRIKKNLKKIDKQKIRPKLNIDDDGEIKATHGRLEALARNRNTLIRPTVDETAASKAEARMQLMTDGGVSGPSGKRSDFDAFGGVDGSGKQQLKDLSVDKAEINDLSADWITSAKTSDFQFNEKLGQYVHNSGQFGSSRSGGIGNTKYASKHADRTRRTLGGIQNKNPDREPFGGYHAPSDTSGLPFEQNIKEGPMQPNELQQLTNKVDSWKSSLTESAEETDYNSITMGKMGDQIKHVGDNFKKYSPNIMMWWKLVALLLPMMIALRVQMMAVAASMYAIVGAGAAMVGLGLVGHGEAIQDSFALAERQINKVKRELFQTFKPALSEFAPISGEFLAKLPQRLEPLVSELQKLTIFEGSFLSLFDKFVDFAGELINTVVSYADEMDQLAHRFGNFLGDSAIGMFEWLIETAYEQQDVMMGVVEVFVAVIGSVWELLQLVSKFMALLAPLVGWMHKLFSILNNGWIPVIISLIAVLYILIGVVTSATKALLFMYAAHQLGMWASFKAGIISAIGGLKAYIATTWAATSATYKLAAAIAATGIGALLVGGGSILARRITNSAEGIEESRERTSGVGAPSGGNTYHNEFHVHGDDSKDAARRLEEKFPDMHNKEHDKLDSQSYDI